MSPQPHLRRTVSLVVGSEATIRAANTFYEGRTRTAYRITEPGRSSRARLARAQNCHQGERCFIIGNGPSLNLLDLSRLSGETTFALNRGYLLKERLGADPTYLVCVNPHVIDQFGAEIAAAGGSKFLSWPPRSWAGREVTYLRSCAAQRFANDPRHGVWEGGTVTFVALQLAFWMGFDEVNLIGVDHEFSAQGPANQLVRAESADLDHFDPAYFARGTYWQLPDLPTSERAYRLALEAYGAAGRRLVNATAGGKLEIFPRVAYSAVTALKGKDA